MINPETLTLGQYCELVRLAETANELAFPMLAASSLTGLSLTEIADWDREVATEFATDIQHILSWDKPDGYQPKPITVKRTKYYPLADVAQWSTDRLGDAMLYIERLPKHKMIPMLASTILNSEPNPDGYNVAIHDGIAKVIHEAKAKPIIEMLAAFFEGVGNFEQIYPHIYGEGAGNKNNMLAEEFPGFYLLMQLAAKGSVSEIERIKKVNALEFLYHCNYLVAEMKEMERQQREHQIMNKI